MYWTIHVLSQFTTAQSMLGSPRGQTVSPSAQKELEDSCSQPADTDRNSDKHEDLNSHTTQQIVVELQLPSFQTLSYDIV